MTAVVDTSVLLALLYPDDRHNERASALLQEVAAAEALVINDVVYSELAANPYFEEQASLDYFLDDIGIDLREVGREVTFSAGTQFREYLDRRGEKLQCPACGERTAVECPSCDEVIAPRQHIAADFLIGAHAEREDGLLTFDEGFYREYFDVAVRTVTGDQNSSSEA